MVTVAYPWTVEPLTFATRLIAAVSIGIVICMFVFATASQDPRSFSCNVEEGLAKTALLTASACKMRDFGLSFFEFPIQ